MTSDAVSKEGRPAIAARQLDLVDKLLDRLKFAGLICLPMFIIFAIYNEAGLEICRRREKLIGTIVEVIRNQGRHHTTTAVVEYPSPDGLAAGCRVKTWFRGADAGIRVGATISVVPALSSCGPPWFPDHIPPPSEALICAAASAIIAAITYGIERLRRGA